MSDLLRVDAGLQSLLASQGLHTLDDFFAIQHGDRLDKPGLENWRQRWRLRLSDGHGRSGTFYLKRFERPPWSRQWHRWLEGGWSLSTAGVEWSNARALADAGIRAVEPVAFGQSMCGPWEARSFVLLSEAPGESLERWVPVHVSAPSEEMDWRTRKARVDALARFVAKFHAAGFTHRDLYLCHIFYAASEGKAGEFCLIDLQRVFRPRWRGRRWVVKDLSALHYSAPADRVSRWDRLRFLCRYVRTCGKFGSARGLASEVKAKSDRIARRYQRLGSCG